MCGVPVHAADQYLQRLIRAGHRVAICEQMEDPAEAKKRGGKSVVRRDVIRLVTPGTLTEDTLLETRQEQLSSPLSRASRRDASLALGLGGYFLGRVRRHAESRRSVSAADYAATRARRDHLSRRALARCDLASAASKARGRH